MDEYTQPNFGSIALITIDLQRDALPGGAMEIAGSAEILPKAGWLAEAFRRTQMPIFHIVRLYERGGRNAELCRRHGLESGMAVFTPGTPGSEIAPDLLPDNPPPLDHELLLTGGVQRIGTSESIIYKPRWGAFYKTPLERELRALEVTTVAFVGVNFPNCPRTSIYEASERDFRIVAAEDAIAGLDDRGKEELRAIGVNLMSAADLEEAVSGRRSSEKPTTV